MRRRGARAAATRACWTAATGELASDTLPRRRAKKTSVLAQLPSSDGSGLLMQVLTSLPNLTSPMSSALSAIAAASRSGTGWKRDHCCGALS